MTPEERVELLSILSNVTSIRAQVVGGMDSDHAIKVIEDHLQAITVKVKQIAKGGER